MNQPLWKLSADKLSQAYRKGELRPSEVLEAVLERSAQVDTKLNLFATLDAEGARSAAAESDRRFAEGAPKGALDGVPLTIKDNIPVKGLRCAWGSKLYLDSVPEEDELPVARLRAGGAVIVGKTNVSEFTLGRGNVNTLAFGTTRNPWNPALTSGASTGGGASAVAAGVCPVAYGTDGGGSIRRPAGYTGLVGLKPSTGRVARRDGLPIILHDFEVVGPLARSVDDVALALSAIEGPDTLDRDSLAFTPGALEEMRKGLRVLYVPRMGDMPVDAQIAESCASAARHLEGMGLAVEEGPAPFDVALFEKHWPVVGAAGLAWLLRDTDWEGRVGEPYPPMIEKGRSLTAIDYIEALTAYRTIYQQLAENFGRFDLVMTPSSGAVQWKAEDYGPPYHRAFTGFVNAAGLPAVSVPGDPTADGLPVGFQLIAPFGADWDLLAVAKAYETAHPWADRWPPI